MGKKGGWFSAVKKALSPEAKEKKDSQRNHKSKKWFGKQKSPEAPTAAPSSREPNVSASVPPPLPPPAPQPVEEVKFNEVVEDDPEKHAYSVAIATAAAAEAAVAAAQAAAEVVRLTSTPQYVGKSKEEIAAIKIQTAFRGYLARRALRALRGLVRLKSLIEGQSVKKQATNTLKCMQTLARLQSQIRTRRIRMSEENQALQRQLQQKHEKELEKLKMGENWDISLQSKEQIEASLQSKQEAALRRERALAYAYSHQSRKNSKSTNATFMDPNNPHWGWSWLERWMAARPWEARSNSMHDKDFNDHSSVKSGATRTLSVVGDISVNSQRPSTSQRLGRPVSRHSPAAQSRGTTPSANPLRSSTTIKPSSPRGPLNNNGWGGGGAHDQDDNKSMVSVQSDRFRRHSIAGSSVRDDESLASSPAVPSYMAPTKSHRAKAKLPSPLGASLSLSAEKNGSSTPDNKVVGVASSAAAGSAKKRLSFPASNGPRRHSVPGKIESTPIVNHHTDENGD